MDPLESKIAKLLLDRGMIDQFQYQSVRETMIDTGQKFHLLVLEFGMAPELLVTEVVAKATGLPQVSLQKMKPDPRALSSLPIDFCRQRQVYPCAVQNQGKSLWLAMLDPTDTRTRGEAEVKSGMEVQPVVALPSEIRQRIEEAFGPEKHEEVPFIAGKIDLGLLESAEQEFKVTDLAGATAVRSVKGLAAATGAAAPDGAGAAPERLQQALRFQQMFSTALEGLFKVLVEKGLVSPEERDRILLMK